MYFWIRYVNDIAVIIIISFLFRVVVTCSDDSIPETFLYIGFFLLAYSLYYSVVFGFLPSRNIN